MYITSARYATMWGEILDEHTPEAERRRLQIKVDAIERAESRRQPIVEPTAQGRTETWHR